jgi:hypothetical protein
MPAENVTRSQPDPPNAQVPGWILKLSRWSGGFIGFVFAAITYVIARLILGLVVSGDLKMWLSLLAAVGAGAVGFLFGKRFFQAGYWKLKGILKPAILILAGVVLLLLIIKLLR